eukprot:Sspe_Gene.66678::Locus_39384_Transcript_2_2_Confidence_0.500_Length_885::g.66678::m.66678
MDTIYNLGAKAFEVTSDAMNPINRLVREACPDQPGPIPYFTRQKIIDASNDPAGPSELCKYLLARLESGGAYAVSKTLSIIKTLLTEGSGSFSTQMKMSTGAIAKIATMETRRDTVEETNKEVAKDILTQLGVPVPESRPNSRYMGISSHDSVHRTEPAKSGLKTPWEEMQEQKQRDARRREKELKKEKERIMKERAEQLKKEAVTFDITQGAEKVVDKIIGGTRKKIPQAELLGFTSALYSAEEEEAVEVMQVLSKKLGDEQLGGKVK